MSRELRKLKQKKRFVWWAKLAIPWNVLLAAGKLLVGIFTSSFFLCVNAFYNTSIGLSKFVALKSHLKTMNKSPEEKYREQFHAYRIIGFILIAAGLLYAIYCTRLFYTSEDTRYPQIVALGIAAVTFTEIIVSSVHATQMRKVHEPMLEAIKLTNLTSSLISLVLTQTAILSFTNDADFSWYNGLSGVVFGVVAASVGIAMILWQRSVLSGKYAESVVRKARKLAGGNLEILACENSPELPLKLSVRVAEGADAEIVKRKIVKKLRVELVETP